MILTLCGSAKFEPWFHAWNKALTLSGHVVISLGAFPSIECEKNWYTDEQKLTLDMVHLSKIEESDAIVVLNCFGYIGESTMREIEFARVRDKQLYFLETLEKCVNLDVGTKRRKLAAYHYTRQDNIVTKIDTYHEMSAVSLIDDKKIIDDIHQFDKDMIAKGQP